MDCKVEILLYAKTGAIFAKCDGFLGKKEKNDIGDYLSSLKENERFSSLDFDESLKEFYENILPSIVKMKKTDIKSVLNKELIPETKEYLDSLSDDEEKQELVNNLDHFIDKIINSDGDLADDEGKLRKKWQNSIYPYLDMKVPSNKTKKVVEKSGNVNRTDHKASGESFLKKIKRIIKKIPFIVKLSIILIVVLIISTFIGIEKEKHNKDALASFPLSSYTEKMLQFKEIDFSKVLIYGTETDSPERDSLLLYFVKGTAVLRFRGLDNLSIDTSLSTEDTLVLNYNMENQTALPIDVEIIYDESKCRFIDSIEATTLKNSPMGKTIKGISTVAGTIGGGYVGNAIGGLFGLKGQIIGLASGSVLGGVGGYIASANFVKKTKIVKDNTSSTIRDMLEDAKPIIAAQLLQDETVAHNTDKNELDLDSISKYYRQQLTDILTNIICNDEKNKWQNVEIYFTGSFGKN